METLREKYETFKQLVEPHQPNIYCPAYFLNENNTGIGFPLGGGNEDSHIDNTKYQANQMAFALTISENSYLESIVKDISAIAYEIRHMTLDETKSTGKIREQIQEIYNNLAQEFIDRKVLSGIKALDLGCGELPSFATSVRRLGGESYTVDIVDPSKRLEEKYRKDVLEHHIFLDLNDKDAVNIIKNRTGGEFDMTSSAHIYTGGWRAELVGRGIAPCIYDISLPLTKKGGFYFFADLPEEITQKQ
jgi:hypothetical protein